jgi:curved DNA-binding protein CbpA
MRRRANRGGQADAGDPFGALRLSPDPELTDDDVRAAWRRVAAATHPDRPDGGDPAAFASAAAAYAALRTRSGRGEAMAGSGTPRSTVVRRRAGLARGAGGAGRTAFVPLLMGGGIGRSVRSFGWRLRGGRPGRLALRLAAAVAVSGVAVLAVGWQPATDAVIAGACTWLVLTGRQDLAG